MVIDVHAHLGHWYFPISEMTPSDLLRQMDRFGIDCTLVSSSLALRYDFVRGNRELAESLVSTSRILAYVTVNLHYPHESIDQIHAYKDYRDSMGMRRFVGVKIHPMIHNKRFDTKAGLLVAEAALQADLPILIHTYGSERETPRQILPVLREFPDLKIILAHAGGLDWHLAADIADSGPHVYAEISSSCSSPDKVLQLLDAFGSDRVLFGTDTTLFHPGYALGMVQDTPLSEAQRVQVLGGNALQLFSIEDREQREGEHVHET
jgi:predicted TIM-barrel fold metal-dependent hydrolase